jgi:hypothetical protein
MLVMLLPRWKRARRRHRRWDLLFAQPGQDASLDIVALEERACFRCLSGVG